jgi:steroid delta-isomerase-like uncharacterized protein
MPTTPKSIVRRLYEDVWNKRRFDVVSELVSPSHALNDPHLSGAAVGPDAYKRVVSHYVSAFPDLQFKIEDFIAENEKVVAFWLVSGTHEREFRGIPPTQKKISIEGVTIHHVANGKVIESYVNLDYLGLMQQLGAVPIRPFREIDLSARPT